jgi:hypothetical protein
MIRRSSLAAGTLGAVALLTLSALGPSLAPAHAATSATVKAAAPTRLTGTLQPGFASQAPTTLVISTTQGMVNVNVVTSTVVVRRYNGLSALDELSPGDQLVVSGAMSGTNVLNATRVKDFTIQRAFTRNVGTITGFNSGMTQLSVTISSDPRHQAQNPLHPGQTVLVAVTPAMSVTLSDGSLGTVQDNLSAGMAVTVIGVLNRNSLSFNTVFRIRVWSPTPGKAAAIHGVLQSGFSTTLPSTLTVQTKYLGIVTVTVDSSARIQRRYSGAGTIDQLNAGDNLSIAAIYQGNGVYSAKIVRDMSVQEAASLVIGRITSITSTTSLTPTQYVITLTVVRGGAQARNPFLPGETVTLYASINTSVLLRGGASSSVTALQAGMVISATGLVDRKALAFNSVNKIVVIRG